MKSYAFLYNPTAGAGKSEGIFYALKKEINKHKNFELYHSTKKGGVSTFIDQRFDDFDFFVACGGDGTVREIASKLIGTEKKMGIIPMGTGNDLCKTLKIPQNFNEAFNLVQNGGSCKIDVGQCNESIFLNVLGFGFDGLTNRYASTLKHLPPFLCYSISAIKAVFTHDVFSVDISRGEQTIDRSVIMVSLANGKVEGGSFWIAPEASITDGKLNCVLVNPIKKWAIPFLIPLFLLKKPHLIPQVNYELVEQMSLKIPEHVDIHADGEVIESQSGNYDIHLIPKGLDVICQI